MTEFAAPDTSTVLDAEPLGGTSGGGAPRTLPAEPPSLRDTITDAMKEEVPQDAKPDESADETKDEKAPEKGAEKPEGDEKPPEAKEDKKPAERAPDGKFAPKQEPEGEPKGEPKPDTKPQGHIEPPAKFLPDAKEKWLNTPRAVQRDVENLTREHEAEVSKYRESHERYESVREYDELARSNGRDLKDSLARVVEIENALQANPIAGLNRILMEAGPRKPDGQPVSLYEVAEHIVRQGPQGYQQMVAQVPQQQMQQREDPRIEQLQQQLAEMKEQQIAATVIEPFMRDHPRYNELQADIAFFLQSGKISNSLSPLDRLEAAYDMAVRINPASHAAPSAHADPDPGDRAAPDFSGSKSIKSAPGAVSPDLEPDRGGSTRDIIRDQMRRSKVA